VSSGLDTTTSDEALLDACLRGEQTAWDLLVDRYAALIYSVPLRFGFGEADAADVFQAVCVTLFENLGNIRAPKGLAAWIITTTSRQCIALARQRNRELARRASGDTPELLDPEPLPDEELLALERKQIVRVAISQLSSPCRELISTLFSDAPRRATYDQVARDLDMSPNSLGPTRARCLARLRRLLVAAGYGGEP
jgi:RNA polymerase sigma factor (sigma-70 family)